jgi:hypothetical protein
MDLSYYTALTPEEVNSKLNEIMAKEIVWQREELLTQRELIDQQNEQIVKLLSY